MIHTYKRKGTSLNTCSFYDRLCGDSLAECSARATHIEGRLPNGCCSSRENEKAKCEGWSECDLSNNSKFYQSEPSESLDAPPIKFKYTRRRRRPKELHKSGWSLEHVAVLPLIQEENQSISNIDTTQPKLDRLCCDPCSLNLCRTDGMWPCGSLPSQNFRKEENKFDGVSSSISANESTYRHAYILHKTGPQGKYTEDCSSFQNYVELGGMRCANPLQTYSRRSRDNNEDSHRTYADLMADRSTFLACDLSFSKNTESPVHQAVVKTTELSESKIVDEHSLSFYQSLGKPTYRVSSVGNMMCSQENQKVRNGRSPFDEVDASTIPSLNDEAVTGQPDDTIKPHHNICGLSLHTTSEEPSTDTVMADAYESIIHNSQNRFDDPEKAGAASQDFSYCSVSLDCSVLEASYSDKGSEVDVNLAVSIKCQEAVPLQSEPLQQSAEKIQAASVHAEDSKANSKEILETMSEGIKETNGLFDINVKPSKDAVSASTKNKMTDPVASSNDSSCTKVLQLFPEDATDDALQHNTSESGLVPSISSNSYSVTVALPDLSVSREIIQDKVVQSSTNRARHKLLLDSIRSSKRPQMEATEGFHQKFQPFASFWCEEELDNLWVGVRRHGKDNWYAVLRDPRLRFAPWRTASDLAEKWIMEKTKLLGSTLGPHDQPSNPVGIQLDSYRSSMPPFMPPGPGFMTRFLTDPMQLSLSNVHLNQQGQGMFPPRPPHNSTNVPGNGTRLFKCVRAHRKSQRPENSWGRCKVGNQVMLPPRLPTSFASTSRINILPNYVRDAFHYPHALPPRPVPPLSAQHLSNQSPFHDKLIYNAIASSSQNGFHLPSAITDCPTLAAFSEAQLNETKQPDPKRHKVSINLESDASSEGTISDDDKPTLLCK